MRIGPRAVCATLALLFVGLACSLPLRAADVKPEALLSEQSVVYFRFDGFKAHQAELDKTIFAQILADDLHPLLQFLKQLALNAAGPDVVAERLLSGAEPGQLIELQKSAKQLPLLVEKVAQRGLLVGVETPEGPVPGGQVTLVFPGAGEKQYREAVFAAVRVLAALTDQQVDEVTSDGRKLLQMAIGPVLLACWQEGDHVVATYGTALPDSVIALAKGERKNLTANPLFARLDGFQEYDTYARGFFDTRRGIAFIRGLYPPAAGVLDKIGVSGLTSVQWHLGCQDELLRSTTVLDTAERKGILAAFSAAGDLKLEELPPLPPDAGMVVAATLDAGGVYDATSKMIDVLVQTANPGGYEAFKSELEKFEKKLGGDVRRDLNEALDSNMVAYSSPSEGALFLATALAFKVKDEKKLHAAVERLFRTLAEYSGAGVSFRRQAYRGGELNVVEFDSRDFPFAPTYAVQDGWFVIAMTPQPAQGLILRSGGKFSKWRPGPVLERAMKETQARRAARPEAKVFAVTQVDPRPTVTTVLSYASFVVAIARSGPFSEGFEFDPTLIPNAQAISERLSPNASVVLDDGKSIRIDSYDTLPMPFDISGIGSVYAPALLFSLRLAN